MNKVNGCILESDFRRGREEEREKRGGRREGEGVYRLWRVSTEYLVQ
jgi:hypothetical protein